MASTFILICVFVALKLYDRIQRRKGQRDVEAFRAKPSWHRKRSKCVYGRRRTDALLCQREDKKLKGYGGYAPPVKTEEDKEKDK